MVMTYNMKAKRFANGLEEYLFRAVPLTRTSTYSDVLVRPCVLKHGLKRDKLNKNLERKLRQGDKCLNSLKLLG